MRQDEPDFDDGELVSVARRGIQEFFFSRIVEAATSVSHRDACTIDLHSGLLDDCRVSRYDEEIVDISDEKKNCLFLNGDIFSC